MIRRIRRVLGVAFVLALALAAGGCRRRAVKAEHLPAPAGGAAGDTDAGDVIVEDARRYAVQTWTFALERYELRIEDVGLTAALDAVLERTGAELVVNAGFFGKDGKAVGLAVSDGAELAPLARSLSGGVVALDGDRARLFATEGFIPPEGTRFAIQCRPRLVVDGAPNVKSDDGKRSERTALCLRDGGKTLDVVVVRGREGSDESGPSLYALGRWLSARGCEGALNLDGGPSTGVVWRDGGGVHSQLPRGPIRHAIAIKPR